MRSFFHSFVVYTLKRYVCNSYKFGDAMPMPRKSRETTVNWESAAFAAATSKSGLLPCRWIMASALVKFEFIVEDNLISRSVCASVRIWMISLGERNIYIFFSSLQSPCNINLRLHEKTGWWKKREMNEWACRKKGRTTAMKLPT